MLPPKSLRIAPTNQEDASDNQPEPSHHPACSLFPWDIQQAVFFDAAMQQLPHLQLTPDERKIFALWKLRQSPETIVRLAKKEQQHYAPCGPSGYWTATDHRIISSRPHRLDEMTLKWMSLIDLEDPEQHNGYVTVISSRIYADLHAVYWNTQHVATLLDMPFRYLGTARQWVIENLIRKCI